MNLGATISIINKKVMNADVKRTYFMELAKKCEEQMIEDMKFNEILDQRKRELLQKMK